MELEVKASIQGGDYKIIRQAIERLDKATRRFAELMMDSAVSGAMKGQTMAQAGESMDQKLGASPSAPHAFAPAEYEKEPSAIEKAEQDEDTPGESTED
jgi:molecular chaperone DnaK/molecular chaperone HscA